MTKRIICLECKPTMEKLIIKSARSLGKTMPVGEQYRFIDGRSRHQYLCDYCGKTIDALTLCTAFSVWNDLLGNLYHPWEHTMLVVRRDNQP